ncbi:glycosyltransferase family 2 protein [Aeromonas veronii]
MTKNSKEGKFFSIITVTYNAENSIVKTLDSIFSQVGSLYEIIIIDGASKDYTIEKIKSHRIDIDVFLSEPDNGIYEAMNKGIILAKGKYIVFMNAGDCFYDEQTLSNVHASLLKNPVDLYAGSSNVLYSNGALKEKKAKPIKKDCYYTPVCHQSLYTKTELMKQMLFDFENYRIAADFDFMMKVCSKKVSSCITNLPLSLVTADGLSDQSRVKVWREYESVYRKYNKFGFLNFIYYKGQIAVQYVKIGLKLLMKKIKFMS